MQNDFAHLNCNFDLLYNTDWRLSLHGFISSASLVLCRHIHQRKAGCIRRFFPAAASQRSSSLRRWLTTFRLSYPVFSIRRSSL